jgi:hypothetical protein
MLMQNLTNNKILPIYQKERAGDIKKSLLVNQKAKKLLIGCQIIN